MYSLTKSCNNNYYVLSNDFVLSGLHTYLSMICAVLDAMEVPYRLDSIKVITETNKRGTVLSKLTLLPYDTPGEPDKMEKK